MSRLARCLERTVGQNSDRLHRTRGPFNIRDIVFTVFQVIHGSVVERRFYLEQVWNQLVVNAWFSQGLGSGHVAVKNVDDAL